LKESRERFMGDTRKRSLAKTIVWRLIGILILGGIAWAFTHSWTETTYITIAFHIIRTILYYYHERMWDRIEWGRYEQARITRK
jgi:uncharacterized membrane protein